MNKSKFKFYLFLLLLFATFLAIHGAVSFDNVASSPDSFPIQKGKLVFHAYTNYGAGDGKLFIYNFETDTLLEISKNWNLQHTINGHFSPDGTKLVFMAQPKGESSYSAWNVYLWEIDSENEPEILTPFYSIPDEDPKFFPDGSRVVFKQNGDIKIIDIKTKHITSVTSDKFAREESMPYPTTDGKKILYARGSKIHMIHTDGTDDHTLTIENNLGCYYPIVKDDTSYLYPRWASAGNHHDEIYLGNLLNGTSVSCPFNQMNFDDSDPFPVPNTDYIFFSSNRSGGQGGWDIHLGHIKTGEVWSLSQFGINSSKMELGSAYTIVDGIEDGQSPQLKPTDFTLRQNYPNPFNRSTMISYELLLPGRIDLIIYDVMGRHIRTLVKKEQKIGNYNIPIDACDLPAGVYIYQLKAGSSTQSRKMLLIR